LIIDKQGVQAMTTEESPNCPHCGEQMLKWQPPPENTWSEPFQYVCFNDDCNYYLEGWEYMEKTRKSKTSYRCRLNPRNNICDPIPVWTKHDLKDGIIE
jgi:hypothetical protein